MRRSLAAALLGISLWIGSLAWSGFLMTETVLNPDRSEDVARALLDDDAVRAQLVDNIAGAVDPAVPVDRSVVEEGAETALASPLVEALFFDAFVRSHRAFLGEGDPPRSIDGTAFGVNARQALVDGRPELAGVLPEAPSVEIPLPTQRIPNLGPVRRGLETAVPVLAIVAALGASLALFVTTDRPGVVRRAGFWAIGLSAVVLVVAFGVPALAQEVAPDQSRVIAALVGALAKTLRGPALLLAGAGAAGVAFSLFWRPGRASATAPVASNAPSRRAPTSPRRPRRDLPTPGRRPPATTTNTTLAPMRPDADAPTTIRPAVTSPAPGPDPTRVEGTDAPGTADRGAGDAGPADPTWAEPVTSSSTQRRNARWVGGVGWVHEGPDPVPAGAKWRAGIGYVLEDG